MCFFFYPELAVQYAVKVSRTNLRDALLEGRKDEPNSWKFIIKNSRNSNDDHKNSNTLTTIECASKEIGVVFPQQSSLNY
jgi:hypothetical protein